MKKVKIIAYLFIALGGLINSCKKPTEGVNLIVNGEEFYKTNISFQFVDASTEEQIGFFNDAEAVSISVLGPDVDKLINNAGGKTFKVDKGFLSVAIDKKYTPSKSNPIEFRVVAHAKGYLSTSVNFSITSDRSYSEYVKMVKINDTPKGVAAVVNNNVSTNGSAITTSTVTISSPTMVTDYEQTKAEVIIPQGTKLKDKNGNNVTGTIETTFAYFNNQDESSLEAFPGGFFAATEGGDNVLFKTGGFVAMEMKNQNGKEVKTFGTPIQMRMEVPANTTNADGELINEGMTIPVWSYDTETGLWKNEQEATITKNTTTDKFEVNFEMNHLSYWNLDWFNTACNGELNVNTQYRGDLTFKFYRVDNGNTSYIGKYIFNKYYFDYLDFYEIEYSGFFFNGAPNVPLIVKVYVSNPDYCDGLELIKTVNLNNFCNSSSQSIDVNVNRPTISATIEGVCSNKPNKIFRPTLDVYAQAEDCPNNKKWVKVASIVNGQVSTSKLLEGKEYLFGTFYDNRWITNKDVFYIKNGDTYKVTIPDDICSKMK